MSEYRSYPVTWVDDLVAENERLSAEVIGLKEIEIAAVESFYFHGYHGGGCMCANCLLKLMLDEHSMILREDRETVKRMRLSASGSPK